MLKVEPDYFFTEQMSKSNTMSNATQYLRI